MLDTNIIIKRESSNNVSFEITSLFKWFYKKHIANYIHRLSKLEIQKHADASIRQNMLIKLQAYEELPTLEVETDTHFNSIVSKYPLNENGKIDNALLQEVYNANVDILLTDDHLMLLKAEELYIRDKVLSSSELLKIFENIYPKNIEYKMLSVKLKPFAEVNLNSEFFDSLREDYEGAKFDSWFKGKAAKGEQAYVFEDKEGLKGFLYLKLEEKDEPDYFKVIPNLTRKRRLKVGTFKIKRTGFRLGERFLKIIFDNARKQNVEEIYVTLFEDKRDEVKHLKTIMQEWGFIKWGYKTNGEVVLVKTLQRYDDKKDPKFNFPLTKDNMNYYFLPIYAEYHTDLFPDNILKSEDMSLYEENKGHRYAIEKMYLTSASSLYLQAGDLLLIYRLGERNPKHYSSVVTGIAIVQEIITSKNRDELVKICKDKSIFSEEQIRSPKNNWRSAIKLLDYMPFKNKVTLKQLRDLDIIDWNSGPRLSHKLSCDQYEKIYKLGMTEE